MVTCIFLVQGRRKPIEVIPQCNQAINYNNDLRLYNGTDSSGILQIYDEDESEWGNLCGDNFTMIEGEIACRQLGFSALAKITLSQWYDRPCQVFIILYKKLVRFAYLTVLITSASIKQYLTFYIMPL